jgi:cobalamin biosynthesis Mg chelatase CobN
MEIKKEKNFRNFIQIVPETGISVDYLNELSALWNFSSFGLGKSDQERWENFWSSERREYYKKRIVARYEELYPPNEYDYSQISDDAKMRIKGLDEIADRVNGLLASENFSRQEFSRLFVEANKFVYGENDNRYIEEKKLFESEFRE